MDIHVTTDNHYKREWVHPLRLRYWIYQNQNGMYAILDNEIDLVVSPFRKTKRGAVNAFLRARKAKQTP